MTTATLTPTDTARTAAFEAIRRTAKLARQWDNEAARLTRAIESIRKNDNPNRETLDAYKRARRTANARAESIRYAIMTAIDSPWRMTGPGMSRHESELES